MKLHSKLIRALALLVFIPGVASAVPDFAPQLINNGVMLVSPADPEIHLAADGTLYYVVGNVGNYSLWRSDGTSAGTLSIPDISPYTGDKAFNFHEVVGNTFFFPAFDFTGPDFTGTELW